MEPHEDWAKHPDVQELLRYMLAYPDADHSTAVQAVLRGELRTAQAIGLYRASKHFDRSNAKWKDARTGNRGAVYHIWLYHFLGGASAKLGPADLANVQKSSDLYGLVGLLNDGRGQAWGKHFKGNHR